MPHTHSSREKEDNKIAELYGSTRGLHEHVVIEYLCVASVSTVNHYCTKGVRGKRAHCCCVLHDFLSHKRYRTLFSHMRTCI